MVNDRDANDRHLTELIDLLRTHKVPDKLVLNFGRVRGAPQLVTPEIKEQTITDLSEHLLDRLHILNSIETNSNSKTVRFEKAMPRSVISAVALEIFDTAEFNSKSASTLRNIFAELLQEKNYRSGSSRAFETRCTAEIVQALNPKLSNREMARWLAVATNTVIKWRANPYFIKSVEINQQGLADPVEAEYLKGAVLLHFEDRMDQLPELEKLLRIGVHQEGVC